MKAPTADRWMVHACRALVAVSGLALFACSNSGGNGKFPLPVNFDPDAPYAVSIMGADLSSTIDNTFFPAPVGATWMYQAQTDDGTEQIDVVVLDAADPNGAKVVMGADARVIRDTVSLNGEVIEDTWD